MREAASTGQPKAGVHLWHERFLLTCCKRCGVVKRRDGPNKPCPGFVPIAMRDPHFEEPDHA